MIKGFFFAIYTGILMGLAWPTQGWTLLLFVGFVPLLWAVEQWIRGTGKRKFLCVFASAYLAFFLWNAITVWWLHYAQRPDGSYAWEAYIPPVVLNALFMAIIFWLYAWAKRRLGKGLGQLFLLCLWISFEKLHFEWEFAWPWLNLGNGLADHNRWIQWYEYTGILGGSLWVWLVNLGVFNTLDQYRNTCNRVVLCKDLALNLGLIVIPMGISYSIYACYEEKGPALEFVVLQPNVDPYANKYLTSSGELTQQLTRLAEGAVTDTTSFVLAPETALPGNGRICTRDLEYNSNVIVLKNYLSKHPQLTFITGIELYDEYATRKSAGESATFIPKINRWVDVFNSVIQIGASDDLQIYHKSKLVPGVEIFPYKKLFEPLLGNLLLNFGGTVMGRSHNAASLMLQRPSIGINIAPVICYESVFGEYVSQSVQNGAQYICILTNDAWWGTSEGYRQHLDYARLRAIENRRSVARSANTGVSSFIDQRGDIISSLPYGEEGALRCSIQANNENTFYTLYGDVIARVALFFGGILFAYTLAYQLMARR